MLGSVRLLCSDMSDCYVLLVCKCHTDVCVLEEVQRLPCGAVCDEQAYLVHCLALEHQAKGKWCLCHSLDKTGGCSHKGTTVSQMKDPWEEPVMEDRLDLVTRVVCTS